MNASRCALALGAWLVACAARATPLDIEDGPFVRMRAALHAQGDELLLVGDIRRAAPRTVRALRGHVHLYLEGDNGRELASVAVPYHPTLLSRDRSASSFSLPIPVQNGPVTAGRLAHHLTADD